MSLSGLYGVFLLIHKIWFSSLELAPWYFMNWFFERVIQNDGVSGVTGKSKNKTGWVITYLPR
jgi:hypothetical protein